ncbi:MAG TPA: NAD(P)/FAD-dependent oxidoreductase [Pyrinomonadaceae bacterium]|nr:NAD(P)/FAD-dependent oxidoreductase [Pyrinomonadaceae bacterium]
MSKYPHVVIVGAGFGGLGAAEQLAHVPVEVTLIDRHNYHTFQPLLYQVATSLLNAEDVGAPVRSIFRHHENVNFHLGTVTGIDVPGRKIYLENGNETTYDYLVLAGGATVNYFGTPGAAEHAFPLYTLVNAVKLRNQVMQRFEAAALDPAIIKDGGLTFVVAGAGPTGVETAGALSDLFYNLLPQDYHQLATEKARIIVVEMGQEVLATFQANLRAYARKDLEERRVELRLGEAVAEVGPTSVKLKSGEEIKAHTLVWAAGVQASPLARILGMPLGRGGRVKLNPDLSVPDHPDIFVVGDMGEVASEGKVLPQLASVAMQSGEHVGKQIARRILGEETQPFEYWDKGFMATIGRGSAVVEFPNKRTLHGPLAYFAWLGVHLALLTGMRNRIETLWNWGWSALTHDRAARIIITEDEQVKMVDKLSS